MATPSLIQAHSALPAKLYLLQSASERIQAGQKYHERVVDVFIGVINDSLVDIQSDEINSGQRSHAAASKGAMQRIDIVDIVDTTVILNLLCVLESLVDKL